MMVGCSSKEIDVAGTAQSQIIVVAASTINAIPSSTPLPTQLPYDTATPYPTASPYPTATPLYTATPYATNTPYPTFTIESTVTATETAPQAPLSEQPTVQPTASISQRDVLLQIMLDAQSNIGQLMGVIDTAVAESKDVDCAAVISHYDTFVPATTFDVSGNDLAVQNAYSAYQGAIQFIVDRNDLIEDCRNKLATGDEDSIPHTEWVILRDWLNNAADALGNAIQVLRVSSGD